MNRSKRLMAGIGVAAAFVAGSATNSDAMKVKFVPINQNVAASEVRLQALLKTQKPAPPEVKRPVIQIAILLDTSNSMDGLISQAKTHLWKIVNEFISAKQNGQAPDLRVALYEYGNDSLSAKEGYIRQVTGFTDDLDKVSEDLFGLKTNGGSEFCGQVIGHAADTLAWSKSNSDFKAIFIAGNEPFTQGPVKYADACKKAIAKGIVINTIFCGNEAQGVNGKWKDGAVLADGSFANINQNQTVVHIDAPQDKEIVRLNTELNSTFIAFGREGAKGKEKQIEQDKNAKGLANSVLAQRAATKSSAFYSNATWDLCDALKHKKVKIEDLKEDQLPDNMKKMTIEQRKKYVADMAKKREAIAADIKKLSGERTKYVAAERKKLAEKKGEESLDEAIVKSVRSQGAKKGFTFEK